MLSIGQLENSRRFKLVQSDADVCIPYMLGLVALLRARRSQYVALLAKAGVVFRELSPDPEPAHNAGPPDVEDPLEFVSD